MNRIPEVFIIYYFAKRGPLDDSIGERKSMLSVGFDKADVKNCFEKSNGKHCQLIAIEQDTRQVAISGELFAHILQSECPKYVQAVAREERIMDEKMKHGRQYNSAIVQKQDNLLKGI